jgi:hypothetical protein
MPRGFVIQRGHSLVSFVAPGFLHAMANSANFIAHFLLLKQRESSWNIPARCLTKTKRKHTVLT